MSVSPSANYVSSKQHKQAGTEQADGNVPFSRGCNGLAVDGICTQSSRMLCKYNIGTVESYWDAGSPT